VPPRGRMPRTSLTPEFHGQPLERATPPVPEAHELVPVRRHALAHHGPDDRVETGAVPTAGQHTNSHNVPVSPVPDHTTVSDHTT